MGLTFRIFLIKSTANLDFRIHISSLPFTKPVEQQQQQPSTTPPPVSTRKFLKFGKKIKCKSIHFHFSLLAGGREDQR